MENYNRIHWKKGLDVSPDILIASDNYHIAKRNLLGRFFASQIYGILPNSSFYIEKSLDYDKISIQNLQCTAITSDGHLVDIQSDMYNEIEINRTDSELYLILTIDPFLPVDEQELTARSEYQFVLERIEEHPEKGIPVLKIIRDFQGWKIDENYIPPVVALNAMEHLKQKYFEIKEIINKIVENFPEEDSSYGQLMMLCLELRHYSPQKPPEEFVLLMKKFCLIFQRYLKDEKNSEESHELKKFMEEPYLHHDIEKTFHAGFEALSDINQKIEEKPVVEEITEFEIKI
jgi:hypothetical protein